MMRKDVIHRHLTIDSRYYHLFPPYLSVVPTAENIPEKGPDKVFFGVVDI